MLPEKILKKLNAAVSPAWKTCFFTAIVVGLLAHLYKITSWLPNWDSLVFRYDAQNMVGLGRWFLPVACGISSFYDLPFLNGFLAIVFHALGAVGICEMFRVQKNITAGLIGATIVSFPAVTSVMMYNYVADGYSLAFFLSVLAAFYMTKEKPKYLLSAVLIALATGIYQAYITVTIMLILLKLIDALIYQNADVRIVWKKTVQMLLAGILGVAIYGVVLKIMLSIFSAELLDYQGVGTAASLAAIDLPGALYTVKQTFLHCFFDVTQGINVYVVINAFVLIATLFYSIKYLCRNKLYKAPVKLVTVVLLSAMLILGAGALAFINAGVDYHNLMRMGYVVFYLFFLLLYERGKDKKYPAVKAWIVFVTSVVLTFNQVVIANVSYHKAQMAYEKSYGVLLRIADRLEQTPGAEACEQLLVLGALENSEAYSVNLTPEITGITDGFILRADDETVGQSVLCSALNDYCYKRYAFVSGKEKERLAQSAEVKAMPTWPQAGCVQVMDNVVVIKLGTEGEK